MTGPLKGKFAIGECNLFPMEIMLYYWHIGAYSKRAIEV